ncbi:MAG: peptidoglycan DD-metalloendopeptidase family protein [Silicimonas sp.]|nr:peptidoglycan DD-metalloendopeptidase family protein [Silicimonas sp.]
MRRLLASLLLLASPVGAESPSQAAVLQLSEAAVLLSEADTAPDRLAALTETVRAYEAGLAALREGLVASTLRQRDLAAKLAEEEAGLGEFLTLLQTVSRHVEAEALVHPGGALPNIQAGLLVSSMVPELEARAAALEARMGEMAEIAALQTSGMAVLRDGQAGARTARLALAEALKARSDLPPRHATDEAAMQALLESTETLTAFAGMLSRDLGPLNGVPRGAWSRPVVGEVALGFREADGAGLRRSGVVFATEGQALVTAPAPGTVLFEGRVPDQGHVVILEPEAGVLVVLAGLGRSFVQLGQIVDEGAGLGLMGGDLPLPQEKLNDLVRNSGQSRAERLYMEVRQGRSPIDPTALFRPDGR